MEHVAGGSPTQLTDNMKRGSLAAFAKRISYSLSKLRKKYCLSKKANIRGRRVSVSTLPKAMYAPQITIHTAGSLKALDIATRARWASVPDELTSVHVDPALLKYLDVICVANKSSPLANVENSRKFLSLECNHLCHIRMQKEGGWSLIKRSCLVVRGLDEPEVISLFVTAQCDPRIAHVLQHASAVHRGMDNYLKPVRFNNRQLVQANRPGVARGYGGQIAGRPHQALGTMVMDGLFKFRFASGFGYYSRDLAANTDSRFLEQQATLLCGISYMESQHAPVLSEHRVSLGKRVPDFRGILPGLPTRWCPASSVGATVGYACDGHNDSSVPGLTESIFWAAPQGLNLQKDERWTFANAEAGLLFDLQDATAHGGCCLYIPGGVMHNSMPTRCGGHTVHPGLGFVLVTKSQVLGAASKKWFEKNSDRLSL